MPRRPAVLADRLLTRREVQERLGLKSAGALYRWIRAGAFPRPFKIGPARYASRWSERAVHQWIAEQRPEGAQ